MHRFHIGLFLLVSGVSSGERRTEPVAFDGSNQHSGRLTLVRCGLGVSCVEFGEVVPTNIGTQRFEVFVSKVCNQRREAVRVEQFLTNGGTSSSHEALLITVDELVKAQSKQPLGVSSKEVVPRTPPQDFDHVPTSTAETALQFLNDF